MPLSSPTLKGTGWRWVELGKPGWLHRSLARQPDLSGFPVSAPAIDGGASRGIGILYACQKIEDRADNRAISDGFGKELLCRACGTKRTRGRCPRWSS